MIVYLAGTITPDRINLDWREWLITELAFRGHKPLSPMRGKDPKGLSKDGLKSDIEPSLFCDRDRHDLRRANVIVTAYFAGCRRQSIGTWMEAGAGVMAAGKPWIVLTDAAEVVDHPFVIRWASKVVSTKEEALKAILWFAD